MSVALKLMISTEFLSVQPDRLLIMIPQLHLRQILPTEGPENYCKDPKFLDRQVWANSVDPDQTAPRGAVWSVSTLFAILSASFDRITLR